MAKKSTPRPSDSKRTPQAKQTTKDRRALRKFTEANKRKY